MPLYFTREQMRNVDAIAIERYGISSLALMENAGKRCMLSIAGHGPDPSDSYYAIFCGPGNNGGDGLVIARHFHENGFSVNVVCSHPQDRYKDDARINLERCLELDIPMLPEPVFQNDNSLVIVDALLGTGSSDAPRGRVAELISLINHHASASSAPVYAIDIPSGLDADAGTPFDPECCVKAHDTLTLAGLKLGFKNPASKPWTGLVRLVDLDIPRELLKEQGTYDV